MPYEPICGFGPSTEREYMVLVDNIPSAPDDLSVDIKYGFPEFTFGDVPSLGFGALQ